MEMNFNSLSFILSFNLFSISNQLLQLTPTLETCNCDCQFQGDGTYETVSQMIFTATRFENNAMIRCEGDNVVMRNEMDKPLHDTLVLEVMCK